MKHPLLSILIPTVVGREEQFNKLIYRLNELCEKATNKIGRFTNRKDYDKGCAVYIGKPGEHEVEIMYYRDEKLITIGEKREALYKMANGLFSWMPDDDDDCSDNAIQLILEAIKSNPEVDCVTFLEYVNINGNEYKSRHSLDYFGWEGDGSTIFSDGFHFHRTPFFKDVIRTDIACSVPVPHERWGEDNMWADELRKVLKTELHIPLELYKYIHISSDHNERYGIK